MDYHYCIKCERICVPLKGEHFSNTWPTTGEMCIGPFTFSVPPYVPEDWYLLAPEPSPEELEVMDLNAVELLAQFV